MSTAAGPDEYTEEELAAIYGPAPKGCCATCEGEEHTRSWGCSEYEPIWGWTISRVDGGVA